MFTVTAADLATAGHAHSNIGSAPLGDLQDVSTSQSTQLCTTDSTGTCHLLYVASPVSGRYNITATLQNYATVTETKAITIQSTNTFSRLGSASTYQLTGTTTQHPSPSNHWSRDALISAIQATAADYSSRVIATGLTLGINDMSLPLGGLFDWHGNWGPPHALHRKGCSVDIDSNVQPLLLNYIAGRHGLRRVIEGPIHYELRSCP
jgi:hypothetical protein